MKKGSITFCVLLGLVLWNYDSCIGVWGSYVYDKTGKNCLTVIHMTNDSAIYNGRIYRIGLYLTPQKLRSGLPDSNYICLDYVGAVVPIYYKWENDSLHLRLALWRKAIIENKLSNEVVLDTMSIRREFWEEYMLKDSAYFKEEYLEWKRVLKGYKHFYSYDM
ncbi:MAG: hypothetical protein J6C87_06705 [Bacteroides sp.]|nr:hypothetical protein [Bacteroides sp.]